MTWVLLIASLLGLGLWYLRRRTRHILTAMEKGVDCVKVGTFNRLAERFADEWSELPEIEGQGFARRLAAAVVNRIFDEPGRDPAQHDFQQTHSQLIDAKLADLSDDEHVCRVLTQAVLVHWTVRGARGNDKSGRSIEHAEILLSAGILIPGGEAPNPGSFLPLAVDYAAPASPG